MMTKKESEREEVGAQLITSLRVAQTLEQLPTELNTLGEKFPYNNGPPPQLAAAVQTAQPLPPKPQPKP